eukprot:2808044-Alexandrium_andersonii.AAC.1
MQQAHDRLRVCAWSTNDSKQRASRLDGDARPCQVGRWATRQDVLAGAPPPRPHNRPGSAPTASLRSSARGTGVHPPSHARA